MYIVEDDTPVGPEPARPRAGKGKSGKKGAKSAKGSKGKSGVKGSKSKSGKKGPNRAGGRESGSRYRGRSGRTRARTPQEVASRAATRRRPTRPKDPEQLGRLLGWMVGRIGGGQQTGVAHRRQRVLRLLLRVNQRCGGRW